MGKQSMISLSRPVPHPVPTVETKFEFKEFAPVKNRAESKLASTNNKKSRLSEPVASNILIRVSALPSQRILLAEAAQMLSANRPAHSTEFLNE